MIKYYTYLLLFFGALLFGQNNEFRNVDYKQIEKEIKNKKSEYYFPLLEERFQKMDTTMTVEHMYHFYYGKSLQDNYDVFEDLNPTEEVIAIESKNETPSEEEIKILKDFYTDVYMNKPFADLKSIEVLAIIYSFNEDVNMIETILNLYYKMIAAILLTGDGNSIETAIDVISPRHEYSILNVLRLDLNQQSLINEKNRSYDLLKTVNEDGKEFDIYFDVTRSFELYNKKFK